MSGGLLIFDMDGVLVDVSESYRETIARTVEHFTGRRPSRAQIQDFKNQGGWNNDWELAHRLIRELGGEADYAAVVDEFQRLFLGDGTNGLILRERWMARPGVLERLGARFELAIFTGRLREELRLTLDRYAPAIRFDPTVTTEDVTRTKPAPDGLLRIAGLAPARQLWYIGDTVDDARCAKAAGVAFIGVSAPSNPRHAELAGLLAAEGAVAVLDDINQLEAVLPR